LSLAIMGLKVKTEDSDPHNKAVKDLNLAIESLAILATCV